MAENMTSEAILNALSLTSNDEVANEFQLSGTVPQSISSAEIKKTVTILGITPEHFSKEFSTVEFDFEKLKELFNLYCKDFKNELQDGVPSKALEFCSKILFEYGPYIRTERKTKGDKAIRFRFPYKKNIEISDKTNVPKLSIKVVIVTTFKDMQFTKQVDGDKLVLTFRQAGLLSMVTFSKAISYCYNKTSTKLLTPLCGAIFSRDSVPDMSKELRIEEIECLKIINESATSGGQYLPSSSIECAIVCMITATKRISDKNIRDSMISKVVKQYTHMHKSYNEAKFVIYAKYALGGVPPGMDSNTLIDIYNNAQLIKLSPRVQSQVIKQAEYDVVAASTSTDAPAAKSTSKK